MLKLLLAEENGPVDDAIREVIASLPDVDLAWIARDNLEVLRLLEQVHPDVILLSQSLMEPQLATTMRVITKQSPSAVILLLSIHNDSRFALWALEAGASGYMLLDRAFEELDSAIKTIMSGHTYLSTSQHNKGYI